MCLTTLPHHPSNRLIDKIHRRILCRYHSLVWKISRPYFIFQKSKVVHADQWLSKPFINSLSPKLLTERLGCILPKAIQGKDGPVNLFGWEYTHEELISQKSFKRPTQESSQPLNAQTLAQYDVKVLWEYSRLQHLLSYAYTVHKNNSEYAYVRLKAILEKWIDIHGKANTVAWASPMESNLRAISLIWIMAWAGPFRPDDSLWLKVLHQLELHYAYAIRHYEYFNLPNNHLLINYLGIAYLAITLDKKEAQNHTIQALKAFDRQISLDGTLYEGSSCYHRFVSEGLEHLFMLAQETNTPIPSSLKAKRSKGLVFLSEYSTHQGLIQIGDNDHGKILTGLNLDIPKASPKLSTESFPNFGSIIIKKDIWRAFLRTKSYSKNSTPRGHFHHDLGSCVITYLNNQVITDPGSACYTYDPEIRNYYRYKKHHSSFGPLQTDTLCCLPPFFHTKDPVKSTYEAKESEIWVKFRVRNNECRRSITIYKDTNSVFITDSCVNNEDKLSWSWVIHPMWKITPIDSYNWKLSYNEITLKLTTSLICLLEPSWFSEHYGKQTKNYTLQGKLPPFPSQRAVITTQLSVM